VCPLHTFACLLWGNASASFWEAVNLSPDRLHLSVLMPKGRGDISPIHIKQKRCARAHDWMTKWLIDWIHAPHLTWAVAHLAMKSGTCAGPNCFCPPKLTTGLDPDCLQSIRYCKGVLAPSKTPKMAVTPYPLLETVAKINLRHLHVPEESLLVYSSRLFLQWTCAISM
jgi:hypothetical protein